MKQMGIAGIAMMGVTLAYGSWQMNTLSAEEKKQGFELLFDGKTAEKWRGFKKTDMPPAWEVVDGELRFQPGKPGGDIVTKEQFDNFELRLEWKVAPGGNSGIMYRATEDRNAPYETGPEYQVLDDALHPDGKSPLTSAASLYGLIARSKDVVRPAGSWNEARIVVKGNHVEHWLNGHKVVEYTLGSPEWRDLIAKSKFAKMPDYGTKTKGHIVLQDHGDPVAYRNLRIRKLTP